jgi:hypothetical protein
MQNGQSSASGDSEFPIFVTAHSDLFSKGKGGGTISDRPTKKKILQKHILCKMI